MPLLSQFTIFFDIDEVPVVFNTLRGTIIQVDRKLWDLLQQGHINEIPEDLAATLIKHGFLIKKPREDLDAYIHSYEASKGLGDLLSVQLWLAKSCNLSCPYCYQSAPSAVDAIITKADTHRFINWVNWECVNKDLSGIDIQFYGGEPLLARKHLPYLMTELSSLAKEHSLTSKYSIVTNGVLLNDDIIDLFIKHRVFMQITLDGDLETHDSRRKFKSTGRGTFKIILNNLERISKEGGIDLVTVRMNVDKDNITEVKAVAEKVRRLGVPRFMCGRIHFREKAHDYDRNVCGSVSFDAEYDSQIFDVLQPLGYADTPSDLEAKYTCLYNKKEAYAISHELDLYKCDELVGMKKYSIGTLDQEGLPKIMGQQYEAAVSRTPSKYTECMQCNLLPLCGSGCAIRALNAKGSLNKSFCEITLESLKNRISAYIKAKEHGQL